MINHSEKIPRKHFFILVEVSTFAESNKRNMSHTIITILWILATWLTISLLVVFFSLKNMNRTGPTLLGFWLGQIWKGLLSLLAGLIWVPGMVIVALLINIQGFVDKLKAR